MRAVYEIYCCRSGNSEERVTINVGDDPTYMENCVKAVKAAGYDPYAQCDCGGGPKYQARFLEYGEPTVEIPFAVIEALAAVINADPKTRLMLLGGFQRDMRDVLLMLGLAEEEGSNVNPVRPE